MSFRIGPYNIGRDVDQEVFVMSKRKVRLTEPGESFGARLSRFRQAAGFSQRDLAAEVGISQRMVVYYEKECQRVPTATVIIPEVISENAHKPAFIEDENTIETFAADASDDPLAVSILPWGHEVVNSSVIRHSLDQLDYFFLC